MAARRVKVVFSAEIQNFKSSMEAAAQATAKAKTASDDAGKAADKSATEIQKQGTAHVAAGEAAEKAANIAVASEAKATDAATKHKEALEEVGRVAAIGGAVVLAGVGMAVKAYADFDKQMSSVDAATHETAGNMALLRQAAIDAGADTAFSAVEAAKGIEELAKAGVSTKDILGGGLTGALSLAAAGSLDVGDAAEIAASALVQFKLSGDKVPHVADLLAAAAGKAQGSVADMGAALNQSGLVAASTGLTIEETTGTLAAFASAGLTGSDAGTSFKTMLMSLNPNSAAAASLMDQLGLSAYDAQGKFVGMSEYAGILQDALKGMSDEQRNATLKTIFGSDAVRAANVLYENGSAGINKWESAVNDAGYAADTAARMQNNLAGDLEKLGGSFDTVLIQSGSGANEVLRGLVKNLEGLVDAVGKVPAPVLGAATGIAALVGGAALIGGVLITVIPKIKATKDALNDLAPAGGKARSALDKVGKAAEGLGVLATGTLILAKLAESDYMSKIDTGMGKVADALADVTTNAPGANDALDGLFKDRDGGDLINTVTDLDSAIKRTFNRDAGQQFNDWGESIVNGMTGVKGSSQILAGQFESLDKSLAGLVSSGKTDDAAKAFEKIKMAAENQGVSIDDLKKKFPEYADALKQAEADAKNAGDGGDKAAAGIKAAGDAAEAAKASAEDIAKALEDVGLAADGSIVDIDKFGQSLFNAGLLSLSASGASIAYQDAIDKMTESVKTNGTTLDINTEKGRANQSAFNGIAQAAIASAEASAAETLATQGSAAAQAQLQGALRTSYDDLVAAAGQLGITGDEADTMARKALGIPKNVNIDAWIADHASSTLEGIKGKAEALDGKRVTVGIYTTEYFDSVDRRSAASDLNGPASGTGRPGLATGGRVRDVMPGAAGGKVPGRAPTNLALDNVLATVNGKPLAVQSEEWIINGRSSKKYDRELAAINAGTFPKLPGYASGGREYSAQSFGHAPYRSEGMAARAGVNIEKLEINEQSDPRATFAEFARRTQSLTT